MASATAESEDETTEKVEKSDDGDEKSIETN